MCSWRKDAEKLNISDRIQSPPKIFYRDPFTTVLFDFKYRNKVFTAVGNTKRNRYAKTADEPDPDLAFKIAYERAIKDAVNQVKLLNS